MTQISVHQMLESVIGCKWSLTVLSLIRRGICRPGEMEHAVPRLSAKVLNERRAGSIRGVVQHVFAGVPPRVEYRLTEFGEAFARLIDEVDALQARLEATWPRRDG